MRLDQAGLGEVADKLFSDRPLDIIRLAATKGMNAVPSSSAGRLFDAVAAIIGICPGAQSFEGEAAMLMQACAAGAFDEPYRFGPDLSTEPLFHTLIGDIESGRPASEISARFHAGLAEAFAAPARDLVRRGRARAVALSGGCFQNATLLEQVVRRLGDVPVLVHHRTPANDGGLALGQAVIAAAKSMTGR